MSNGVIAKRYAYAFFEVASEIKQVDAVEKEIELIKQAIDENPAFLQFLQHPQISKEDKKKEFAVIFKDQISETTLNFMNLLIDKNREELIAKVPQFFTEKANQARGVVDAVVTSVKPLSDEQKKSLAASFKQLLNKEIRIQNELNDSIMGGVVVQIGDRLYDGSVAGRLNRLQQSLKQAQVR